MTISSGMTRRRWLGLALGAMAGPVWAEDGAPLPSLKELAAAKGIRFGSDTDNDISTAPRAYVDLFLAQASLLAPILSWAAVSPAADRDDFGFVQGNLDFARHNNLLLTGGHFLWQESTPDWFGSLNERKAAVAAKRHIEAMLRRFKGQAWSWNVVNEALEPDDKRPDNLKKCVLLDKLGPDYIGEAFEWARAADPTVTLVYNEYGFENEDGGAPEKRAALLDLLDALLKRKAPIDAVGLQSHIRTDERFDEGLYRKFLGEISSRGLKILISEFDVLDLKAPADIAGRDRAVAEACAQFLPVALDEKAVTTLVVWGLSDRYSWINNDPEPYFVRADKLPGRPLMFDKDFKPKPCFEAVVKALQNAPAR